MSPTPKPHPVALNNLNPRRRLSSTAQADGGKRVTDKNRYRISDPTGARRPFQIRAATSESSMGNIISKDDDATKPAREVKGGNAGKRRSSEKNITPKKKRASGGRKSDTNNVDIRTFFKPVDAQKEDSKDAVATRETAKKSNLQKEEDSDEVQVLNSVEGEAASPTRDSNSARDEAGPSNNGNDTESTTSASSDSDSETEEGEYEVESLEDYWVDAEGQGEQYLVKWKGWGIESNSWEPLSNLNNCDKAMLKFYLSRLEEIKKAKELHSEQPKKLKKILANMPLPPDPRPLVEQMDYFTKTILDSPISSEEIEVAYTSFRTLKLEKWLTDKLKGLLQDATSGRLSDKTINRLREQAALYYGESRAVELKEKLKEWERSLNEIARGRPTIRVVNEVDLAGPPTDFTYVNQSVAGKGVVIPTDPLTGCECGNTCRRRKSCTSAHFDTELSYNAHKRVTVSTGYPIYECNQHCLCGPDCMNRVVQDGTVSLEGAQYCIFRTSNGCGWGVKTLKPIKQGTFVALYAGEVIMSEEAETRGPIYDSEGVTYLFDLDYNETDNPYTIDAKNFGNVSHFMNHSCEPNLGVYSVYSECVDPDLPNLALFAIQDIKKNEELTFDYMSRKKDGSLKLMTCLCGSKSCRKQVF